MDPVINDRLVDDYTLAFISSLITQPLVHTMFTSGKSRLAVAKMNNPYSSTFPSASVSVSCSSFVPQNSFHVVSYNILAKSLGTPSIPWVMKVSKMLRSRIEQYLSQTFQEFVAQNLYPPYMEHFHKNFASGDYSRMRGFWGARCCNGPEDVPEELRQGLTWVEQDKVSYTVDHDDDDDDDDDKNYKNNNTGDHRCKIATTLRGVLRQCLPPDLSHDFFEEIMFQEERIYDWKMVRGPRVFQTATKDLPDILVFQEYDCHSAMAHYRDDKDAVLQGETFSDAIARIGYDGAFFKDPLLGRDPPSGLGVFWRRDVLEPVTTTTMRSPEASTEGESHGSHHVETIECGEKGFGGSLWNVDLEERWHPIRKNVDKASADDAFETMASQDRRNAAIARLRHRHTSKIIKLCAVHLMTTSRDGPRSNFYPGQVRAGEVKVVRRLIENGERDDDHVIFVGDFNIDAKDCCSILGEKIRHKDTPEERFLEIDTGYQCEDGAFLWGHGDDGGQVHPQLMLKEAFCDVHRWGKGVGENKNCTSRNAIRVEWIDYCFYSVKNLRPTDLSSCKTPNGPIPDQVHPSDHLPIGVKFEFL